MMRAVIGAKGRALLMVVLLVGGVAQAGLMDDVNGMSAWQGDLLMTGPMPGMYEVIAVRTEYCVYLPGQFDLSFPGEDPSGGARYIYAYQLFNDLDPHPAAGTGYDPDYVYRFTVGLNTDEAAADNTYLSGTGAVPDDLDTLTATSTQVGWNFTLNQMYYPSVSAVLLFSSPYGPEMYNATVRGWQLATGYELPSPVPEPATLSLLAIGAGWLAMRRRRR